MLFIVNMVQYAEYPRVEFAGIPYKKDAIDKNQCSADKMNSHQSCKN